MVNGLSKCVAVDGYIGVYKTKTVIFVLTLEIDRCATKIICSNVKQLHEKEYRRVDWDFEKGIGRANWTIKAGKTPSNRRGRVVDWPLKTA